MTTTYRCPDCGTHRLEVQVTTVVDFIFDPDSGDFQTDDTGRDKEFTDESAVVCSNCGHSGAMSEFKLVAVDPDDMPASDLATLLTDAIGADVWTDAPECHQRIAIIQDAMAEAAHRLVPATDAAAVEDARSMYCDDELRIDDGAAVIATDKGKWVQAWVFVEN